MPEFPHRFSRLAEDLIGSLRRLPADDPTAHRRRPTQDLATVIEQLRVKYALGREAPEHVVREHWSEIVGTANAAYSHAVRLEPTGRLVIHASHAVVRNELFLHKAEILARIQRLPGCQAVKSLFLAVG
jgi:hypothetical protein